MKNVLITGASGMLGASLVKMWQSKYVIFATDYEDFSKTITRNFKIFDLKEKDYSELIEWAIPDIIIHCASLTNSDYCEKNAEEAMAVNGHSVQKLLRSAPLAKLIFISTDAIFPCGTHLATENTPTGSKNIYGRSKECGESFIIKSNNNSCIVRTTIVGKNINIKRVSFVDWIVLSLKKRKKIILFNDVFFTPITIWHIADELEWVIGNDCPKIMHIAGTEILTKFDFGFLLAKSLGLDVSLILKGHLADASLKAKRSTDQSLDTSLFRRISGHKLYGINETIGVLSKYFNC